MEDARRLAALRDQIALLDGETVFEGWAAERLGHVDGQPGLVLLTNRRLIVADISGGFSAIPISKIDRIDLSATTVCLSAWYEAISLDLKSAAAAATLVNGLKQDPQCRATVGRGLGLTPPPREAVAVDPEPVGLIASGTTTDPAPHRRTTAGTDQRLMMA